MISVVLQRSQYNPIVYLIIEMPSVLHCDAHVFPRINLNVLSWLLLKHMSQATLLLQSLVCLFIQI